MDFKQLEAYVKVYELKNFSRAAEEVFLSQPSVSAYIGSLEKELQTKLIHRSTKEFLPTEPGIRFYEYAKDMLALRDKSVLTVKSFSDSTSGNIDILASSVPSQYMLPELLGAFHRLYPSVTFNLEQADTAEVTKGIAVHKCDIGFVGAKIENQKCIFEEFTSERLIVIAPNEERFDIGSTARLPDLFYDEYFVMREAGSGTRLRYETFLREAGIKPERLKVSARFNNTQSIIHAVAGGLGISIVSELAAKYYLRQNMITAIPLDIPLPERKFYFVLKKNFEVSPIVNVFIEFIRERAANG